MATNAETSVRNAAVQLDKVLPRLKTQHQEEATALITTLTFIE
jgi:excinuclease UvrABC helicase subunit UvrB